jgi:DNA recombination protein RmuC
MPAMTGIWFIIGFVAGAGVGVGIAVWAGWATGRRNAQQMRDAFAALAGEALDANTRRLGEVLAGTERQLTASVEGSSKRVTESAVAQLDGKKALIDQQLSAMSQRLEQVRTFLQQVESRRESEFGKLSTSVASLSSTAGDLHKMLASSQRRGAWGERMAEDVLRLAGLQEHVNYTKQCTDAAENRDRPDFTFLLPNELRCNMDVKFPLEKYKAYLDGDGEASRTQALRELCQAVRGHVRAVAGRGYIDPSVPTVPYVILFIPSEQLFGLVLSAQPDLIDESLRAKVVLASPLTLYAKLAIMRQAAESYNLMRTADEVIGLLGQFHKQWDKYNEEMDKLGRALDSTTKTYETLRTTRTNMLQRPLDKIADLRASRELPDADGD